MLLHTTSKVTSRAKLVKGFSLCLLAVAACGCGHVTVSGRAPDPASVDANTTTLSVMMFDTSGSCKNLRPLFRQQFASCLSEAKEGDRFFVDAITAGAIPTYPIRWEVPKRDWNEYSEDYKAKVDKNVAGYVGDLDSLFDASDHATKPEPGTDILLSVREAAKLLSGQTAMACGHRNLYILSDMIQQSPALDVSEVRLGPKSIASELDRLKSKGLVPDLTGVEVYLLGANVEKAGQVRAERKIQIENFWTAYFKATGATFDKSHYTGSLTS